MLPSTSVEETSKPTASSQLATPAPGTSVSAETNTDLAKLISVQQERITEQLAALKRLAARQEQVTGSNPLSSVGAKKRTRRSSNVSRTYLLLAHDYKFVNIMLLNLTGIPLTSVTLNICRIGTNKT